MATIVGALQCGHNMGNNVKVEDDQRKEDDHRARLSYVLLNE